MIAILNILLFLGYLILLGYSLTRFIKTQSLETIILRLAVGLAALPVLGLCLDRLHLPIDWRIILGLSLIFPVRDLLDKKRPKIKRPSEEGGDTTSRWTAIVLLVLFAFCLIIYCGGSFQYSWLEDDDSWQHAASIKYIAVEQNLRAPSGMFQYLNPYPPAYDIIIAVMHQTHPSLYWTLKFFNGLIISLGYLFFFLFAKEFTKNNNKALLATLFLTAIPCYLSHFIWAHALIVTLFFPAFYALLKLREDKRFLPALIIIITAIFITQPTQSIKFVILSFLMIGIYSYVQKKLWKLPFLAFFIAGLISLLWWGPVIAKLAAGNLTLAMRNTVVDIGGVSQATGFLGRLFSPAAGTATRAYELHEYFFFSGYNLINNPVGIGFHLAFLALLGLLFTLLDMFSEDKNTKAVALTLIAWFTFTFLGVNSVTFHLPIGLVAFRFWMLLAIPVVLLATEAVFRINDIFTKPLVRYLSIGLLVACAVLYSGNAKIAINTTPWSWGATWGSKEEIQTYLWLRQNLAPNTKVFTLSKNWFVFGFDMYSDYWSKDYQKNLSNAISLNVDELYEALKKNNFKYIIIGQREGKELGTVLIEAKILALDKSPHYKFIYGLPKGARIYQIL